MIPLCPPGSISKHLIEAWFLGWEQVIRLPQVTELGFVWTEVYSWQTWIINRCAGCAAASMAKQWVSIFLFQYQEMK